MDTTIKNIAQVSLLAIFILLCGCSREREGSVLYSGIIEMQSVSLASRVGGRVVAVACEKGDRVVAGKVLITLDDSYLVCARDAAAAQSKAAEAFLRKLKNGSRPEDIASAKARVHRAEATLALLKAGPRAEEIDALREQHKAALADYQSALDHFTRQKQLSEKGTVSESVLIQAKTAKEASESMMKSAQKKLQVAMRGSRSEEIEAQAAQLEEARAALALAENGPRIEDIESAQADFERAGALLKKAENDLAESEIRTPVDGIVETLGVWPGDFLSPAQSAVTLLVPSRIWLTVYIPEGELGGVRENQAVDVIADPYPNRTFKGKISRIQSQGQFTPRNISTKKERVGQVFGTEILIDDPENLLRAGMSADVRIKRQ